MANKGGKHYVVVPTLTDISAASDIYAASTTIFCPYKILNAHNGAKEIAVQSGDIDGIFDLFDEGFFQEVMGIVPSKIHNYHTGEITVLTQSTLSTYIDKIRYNYFADGHKAISIIYNQNAFQNDEPLEIEFKVLFEDGDFHSVKQPVIHSMCLDENEGIDLRFDGIFTTTETGPSHAMNQNFVISPITIENAGPDKGPIIFNTAAYTDPKWGDLNSPSATTRDYFQTIYYNSSILEYGQGNTSTTVIGQDGVVYTIGTRHALWEFRQTTDLTLYNYESEVGITGGTLYADELKGISNIINSIYPNDVTSPQRRDNGFRSIEFFNTICPSINATGGIVGSGDDFFDPSLSVIRGKSLDGNLQGGARGYAGQSNSFNKNEVNAFYLKNSPSERSNNNTARRMDGIVFGIRNQNNSNFEGSGFNLKDNGFDTNNSFLTGVAIKLLEGAEAQGINQQLGGFGTGSWLPPGYVGSAGSNLMCNLMSPQDLISNYILGRHTFFLSRPHHLGSEGVNSAQSTYQSSLAASLFRKAKHPAHTAINGSTNLAGATTLGVSIDKLGESPLYITAVPYHIYVDSFQTIMAQPITEGNNSINNFTEPSLTGNFPIESVTANGPTEAFIAGLTGKLSDSGVGTSSVRTEQVEGTNQVGVQVTRLYATNIENVLTDYTPVKLDGAQVSGQQPRLTSSTITMLPSLDKNSVRWTVGNLNEPLGIFNYSNIFMNQFGAAGSLNTFLTNVFNEAQSNNYYTDVTHAQAKAIITQDEVFNSPLTSSDDRLVYLRGCLDFKRGRSFSADKDSNFQLDLLITPGLSSTDIIVTELQFKAKYNAGVNAIPTSGIFSDLQDCGCNQDPTKVEWENASNSNVDDNALNIFDIKYTPGKHLIDPTLFPINSDEFSAGTSVTALDSSTSDTDNLHSLELVVNLDSHEAISLDRPFVDVNLNSFQWDETFSPVSKIQLGQRKGETSYQLGPEAPFQYSSTAVEYSPQTFDFVSLGVQVVQGGGTQDAVPGCTDSTAINYNPKADVDDGSCSYCDEDNPLSTGYGEFLSSGISNIQIFPQEAITSGNIPFGLANFISQIEWWQGQIGNAHNYWGYGLDAATADDGSVAVPYGDNFGDQANPYTNFRLEFDFAPYSSTNYPGDSLENLLTNLIAQVGDSAPNMFSLSFYDIEKWSGENADYAQLYTKDDFETSYLTNGAGTVSIGSMTNQSTDPLQARFASYDSSATFNPGSGGAVPIAGNSTLEALYFNQSSPLTDGFGQTFLAPGKQYLVVLNIDIGLLFSGYVDSSSNEELSCDIQLRVPYNFWVTFCGCDILTAPNYIGDLITDYAWSGTSTFPAGYNIFDQCVSGAGSRIKRNADAESAGYCLPIPDPFNCDNFIDACTQTPSVDCIPLNNGTGQQSFVGTLSVDIFGAFTGLDNADQYAFVFGDELFTFEMWLIEGAWDGSIPEAEDAVGYYSFQSSDDYAAVGFNPSNSGALNLVFTNLEAGIYTVVINQLTAFSFQEDYISGDLVPCPMTSLPSVTVGMGDGTDCPDLVVGCTDPEATNYVDDAVIDDGSCEYLDCDDVYLSGKITEFSTTNSVIDCVVEPLNPDLLNDQTTINVLVDTGVGSITIDAFINDIQGGELAGTFVMGYCQVFNGNSGAAVTNLLDLFTNQNEAVTNTARTETIFIQVGDYNIGGFLGFDAGGNSLLTTGAILDAGYYAIMLIPDFAIVQDQDCTTVLVENFNAIAFATVSSTFDFTDCPTPCNDQTNPEDCGDQIGGCTDENATNYNPLATFDTGICDYSGQEECDQNPDAEGCEDCDSAEASGLPGFRNCDEFNDTTEGCCDPLACNYDSTVDVCLQSRCEYCCDGTEDCIDDPGPDECEDNLGNILPDCVQPECPDPTNPECQEPPVDPCPNGDCGGPPIAECVILGNCPEGDTGGDEDDVVIIDDPIIVEVTCQPTGLGNYANFDEVRLAAMTCSANEGSKLLFKIRSGVKTDRTDLIKLELINYLFNNAINEACMSDCTETTDEKAIAKGINKPACADRWKSGGSEVWTPTSTYGRGITVAVIRYEAGKLKRRFYTSTAPVGSGDISPTTAIANTNVSKWTPCITVRGKISNNPGEPAYIHKLYEFMAKFCEQCSVYTTTEGEGIADASAQRDIQTNSSPSGLVDENGNEIKLF